MLTDGDRLAADQFFTLGDEPVTLNRFYPES